jgi:thioredoxin 1
MKKFAVIMAGMLAVSVISCKGQPEKTTTVKESAPVATGAAMTAQAGTVTHIGKAEFLNLVMDFEKNPQTWVFKGKKPCLVDFYATWCGPCKISAPILEELAKEYAGKIDIYKIDIDKEQELASVFGVQSIPTFLYCPMTGNPSLSAGIANSPEATKQMFKQQIEEILLKQQGTPVM